MSRFLCSTTFSVLLFGAAGSVLASAQSELLRGARIGDEALLQRSMAAGASVDGRDPSYRQTALIRAAMFRQADMVEALLEAGATPTLEGWPEGMQAAHWAAHSDDVATLLLLIRAGVEVDATDSLGRTVLDYALSSGAVEVVGLLLAQGADPERLSNPISGRIGMVLNPDTQQAEVEALLQVIRSGRGLEQDSGFAGERTALLALAARSNRPGAERFAEALVAAGANLAATDGEGRTALVIIEEWIPRQRYPAYRRTMEVVAQLLRQASAP